MRRIALLLLVCLTFLTALGVDRANADQRARVRELKQLVEGDPEDPQGTYSPSHSSAAHDNDAAGRAQPPSFRTGSCSTTTVQSDATASVRAAFLQFLQLMRRMAWIRGR
jgi:hypothetical protein